MQKTGRGGEGGLEADGGEVIGVGRGHRQSLGMRPPATIHRVGMSEGGDEPCLKVRDEGEFLRAKPTAVIEKSVGEAAVHREYAVDLRSIRVTPSPAHGG